MTNVAEQTETVNFNDLPKVIGDIEIINLEAEYSDNKLADQFADNKLEDQFADNKLEDQFADNKLPDMYLGNETDPYDPNAIRLN